MPTLPGTSGFPDMPEAEDFLRAIRRLDFRSENEDPDLMGPPVDADVSGRSASIGGPLSRALGSLASSYPSLRELGLLLDAKIHGVMAFTLWFGVFAFTLLFVYLLDRRFRLLALEEQREAREVEAAIAERVAAARPEPVEVGVPR